MLWNNQSLELRPQYRLGTICIKNIWSMVESSRMVFLLSVTMRYLLICRYLLFTTYLLLSIQSRQKVSIKYLISCISDRYIMAKYMESSWKRMNTVAHTTVLSRKICPGNRMDSGHAGLRDAPENMIIRTTWDVMFIVI